MVYREKVSGAASDRKELARLVRKLERGDTVIVTRLDRLARSTRDLLNILDEIGKAGAGFRSIKDTWADTTTSHGRLMLTILGGLAEFERELIKDRTDAGRVRAKARGVKFGRKPKLNPFQREQALARLSTGETQAEVARTYGVDRATISRLASPLPFEAAPRFPETERPAPMTVSGIRAYPAARPRTLPRLADQSERSPAARACPAPMWGAAAGMPLAAASAQSDWDVSRQGWHPLPPPAVPAFG